MCNITNIIYIGPDFKSQCFIFKTRFNTCAATEGRSSLVLLLVLVFFFFLVLVVLVVLLLVLVLVVLLFLVVLVVFFLVVLVVFFLVLVVFLLVLLLVPVLFASVSLACVGWCFFPLACHDSCVGSHSSKFDHIQNRCIPANSCTVTDCFLRRSHHS